MAQSIVQLKSGRKIYANCDLISINDGEPSWNIGAGYDQMVFAMDDLDAPNDHNEDRLSVADCRQVADAMIARWLRFKASLPD